MKYLIVILTCLFITLFTCSIYESKYDIQAEQIKQLQAQIDSIKPWIDHMLIEYKRIDLKLNLLTDNDYTEHDLTERQVKALQEREKRSRNPLK